MITFDTTSFTKGLKSINAKLTGSQSERAVFAAISALKNDADRIPPKTPHLEGHLRGDYKIEVKQSIMGTDSQLTFLMPYAARWHETGADINWSESGVGPKYVEKKIDRFRDKYLRIMGQVLGKVIR